MSTIVDRLNDEFTTLIKHLDGSAETSLRNTAEDTFRKALLLAAASYFESTITEQLLAFCRDSTRPHSAIPELVRNKALSRQYHTLFNWDAANANAFFGLFGEGFKSFVQFKIKATPELGMAIKAFLELGADRNRLVHMDYGTFTLEKTAEEIYAHYQTAQGFVGMIRPLLDDFVAKEKEDAARAAEPAA